ncbi:helix-turn-helix transcriptional regulator [Corallococcus exiguus]|uniref:LuxR C-terminal-related transcriptional regulator n=1 Tax=Corallococcus exiguus TaxID=83462 RepID=UPI001494C5BD|nr:LuxR C-terminal-related transcriptional regulator [Corallococcus exiguus]NPC69888.1 helix-turn-helix transcriptional regulator [Corallococcus exiguus]
MVRLPKLTAAEYMLRDRAIRAFNKPLTLREALEALRPLLLELVPADSMGLCLMHDNRSPGFEWLVPGHPLLILKRYAELIEHDPFRAPIFARPNWVVRDSQLMSRKTFKGSIIYQRSLEWEPRLEHIMAVLLPIRPGFFAALALYRHRPRAFSAENAAILGSLTEHLADAIRKYCDLQDLDTRANVLDELCRRTNAAFLVVEPPHHEVQRTPNAVGLLEQWFAPSDLHSSGMPLPLKEQLDALMRMTPDERLGKDSWVRIHGDRFRKVQFMELSAPEGPPRWALKMEEIPRSIPLPEEMKRKLRPSEVVVARGVLSNWTDHQIAGELGRSHHTVKTHVKKIFAKLGVDHRADFLYQAAHLNTP